MQKKVMAFVLVCVMMCMSCFVSIPASAEESVSADMLIQNFGMNCSLSEEMTCTLGVDVNITAYILDQFGDMSAVGDLSVEAQKPNSHISGSLARTVQFSEIVDETESEYTVESTDVVETENDDESVYNEEWKIDTYDIFEADKYQTYYYDATSDVWSRMPSDAGKSLYDSLTINLIGDNLELMDGTVTYGDKECYEVDGTLTGDKVIGGLWRAVDSENIFTNFTGIIFGDYDWSSVAVPVSYFFDKNSTDIVGIRIDASDVISDALNEFTMKDADFQKSLDIHMPSFVLELKDIVYNANVTIELPESARTAYSLDDDEIETETEVFGDLPPAVDSDILLVDEFAWTDSDAQGSYNDYKIVFNETTVADVVANTNLVLDEMYDDYKVGIGDLDYVWFALPMDEAHPDDSPTLYFDVMNNTDSSVDIRECVITGMEVASESPVNASVSGIAYDVNLTIDDLIKVLGNPTNYFGDEYNLQYIWESEDESQIFVTIKTETNKLMGLGSSSNLAD